MSSVICDKIAKKSVKPLFQSVEPQFFHCSVIMPTEVKRRFKIGRFSGSSWKLFGFCKSYDMVLLQAPTLVKFLSCYANNLSIIHFFCSRELHACKLECSLGFCFDPLSLLHFAVGLAIRVTRTRITRIRWPLPEPDIRRLISGYFGY